MDRFDVDTSELADFERDLADIPKGLMRKAEKVVSKGALNVKGDWRERWDGHPHFPHPMLPSAIGYDIETHGHTVRSTIGPDKDKPQGALGNIIEFGTINNPPIPGGQPALDAEEPRFVKAVEDLGEDVVRRARR